MVVAIEACLIPACTALGSTPRASHKQAAVCRRSWIRRPRATTDQLSVRLTAGGVCRMTSATRHPAHPVLGGQSPMRLEPLGSLRRRQRAQRGDEFDVRRLMVSRLLAGWGADSQGQCSCRVVCAVSALTKVTARRPFLPPEARMWPRDPCSGCPWTIIDAAVQEPVGLTGVESGGNSSQQMSAFEGRVLGSSCQVPRSSRAPSTSAIRSSPVMPG